MSTGCLIVLSAPSGAGKTTLARKVIERMQARGQACRFSVSYTTRAARPGELEGKDYHFVSDEQFQQMVDQGQMLEYADVFDRRYGTGRVVTEKALADGELIFLDIDWQGAQQLRRSMSEQLFSVSILPPSREALRQRLTGRGQDAAEVINKRMAEAVNEMSHYAEFDALIINDDLERAADELYSLCLAQTLRQAVAAQRHQDLLASLLAND